MNSIRHFLTPANAITSAGLAAGFLALLATIDAQILQATIWVIFAAVLDSLDGAVARRRNDDHAFGTTLDSLADMVSFGVVPAMALYLGPLHAVPILGLGTSLAFLLGAAWRLARFPIVKRDDCFLGMPMPVAGVLIMVFLFWRPAPELALIITGAISALLVSTLPFPTLQTIYRATQNTRRGHPRGRSTRR
jgi:CDP-diacylglycerol---serine O-phosphatidyltransferase